jgi:hypothetical protein
MSPAIPSSSEVFRDADPALQPLVETLNARLKARPLDLAAIKGAMIALLEFLSSPAGRTDANCCSVDTFFFHDDTWTVAELPDVYHDVIAPTWMRCTTRSLRRKSHRISIPHRSNS